MFKSQRLWAWCLKDLLYPVASWCSWVKRMQTINTPFLFAILCAIKYFTKFLKKNEVWLSSNLRESLRNHVQRQWCNRRRKNHHKRVSASLESVLPNSVAEDEIDCCGLDQIFKVRRQSVAIYLAGK